MIKQFNSLCCLHLPLSCSYVVKCLVLCIADVIDFELFLCFQLEAAAVNLVAGEKPADVYSEIAVRYTTFEMQ